VSFIVSGGSRRARLYPRRVMPLRQLLEAEKAKNVDSDRRIDGLLRLVQNQQKALDEFRTRPTAWQRVKGRMSRFLGFKRGQ